MQVSRNEACPCGSGRKYKRCCLRGTPQRESLSLVKPAITTRSSQVRSLAERPARNQTDRPGPPHATVGEWQVDLAPLPPNWDDTRLALGLVVEKPSGLVLAAYLLENPPSEVHDVAGHIVKLLHSTAARVQARPAMVRVKHPAVRAALASPLSEHGMQVRTTRKLAQLDRAFRDMAMSVLGVTDPDLAFVSTGTWSSWGIPAAKIAELFDAAAAFWKAEPWNAMANGGPIVAVRPGLSSWSVLMFGQGKVAIGIALFESMADASRFGHPQGGSRPFAAMQAQSLSLVFADRNEVLPEVREDIKRHGWRLPARAAIPMLHAVNTPAGGVTRAQVADLTAILRGANGLARVLTTGDRTESVAGFWSDPESGVNFLFDERLAGPRQLSAACPQGAGADATARIDPDDADEAMRTEARQLDAFAAWLETRTEQPADAAPDSPRGTRARGAQRDDVGNARLLIEFLVHWQGIPLRAVTAYDLRVFLHDWVHRNLVASDEIVFGLPDSLLRFFEYLETRAEFPLLCPWAAPLLLDRSTFRRRRESFRMSATGESVAHWRSQLLDDLAARALVPDEIDSAGSPALGFMGAREAGLADRLQRQWLIWRDEIVRTGTVEPDAVLEVLLRRQAKWERSRSPESGGERPLDIVSSERQQLAGRLSALRAGTGSPL